MSFDQKLPWDGVNKSDILKLLAMFFHDNQDPDPTLTIASMSQEAQLPTGLWTIWSTLFNIFRFYFDFTHIIWEL